MGLRKFLSQAGQYCGIRFFFFLFAHVYTAFDLSLLDSFRFQGLSRHELPVCVRLVS
jgi:hypothetical protein